MRSRSERVNLKFSAHDSYLECDLSHIHPTLGVLVQLFERNDEGYAHLDQRNYYESIFNIFFKGSDKPGNARHLTRAEKDMIWDEVFNLKNLFLENQQPDVVVHRVKHPFPSAKRCELYRRGLDLTHYDLTPIGDGFRLEHKGT